MSIDLQSRGAAFSRQIMADMQDMVLRLLSNVSATVAAQKEGVGVSDQHRVLNFQGPGVSVSDDPASRRVNILIPGSPVATSTTTYSSSTAAKVLPLWNGSSNNAPPSGWETAGFSDAGWSNAIVSTAQTWPTNILGATWITDASGTRPATSAVLVRQAFTLPAGTVGSASIQINADNFVDEVWVNGTRIYGPDNALAYPDNTQNPPRQFSIPTALLTPAASNLIAVRYSNGSLGPSATEWLITVSQGLATGVPYINIQDRKAQNTAGGTFTSGAWRTRTLNTVLVDTASLATLASNQISLPAGTYRCLIHIPAFNVNAHQARLQNVTDGTTTLLGTSQYSLNGVSGAANSPSIITGSFTITSTKAFEVQHQCQTTVSTNGFGNQANLTTEVYTVAEFFKDV